MSIPSSSFLDIVEINQKPDYSAVIDGKLSSRYESLSEDKKKYVLSFWKHHQEKLGQRTADCYRSGSVDKFCDRGKYTHGVRYRCGDMFCGPCSRPKVRMGAWAHDRDHEIFKAPCVGIEFFGDSLIREDLIVLVKEFISLHISKDALMVDAFDSYGVSSVRAVIPIESIDRKRLQSLWSGKLSIYRGSETYLWAFDGMSALSGISADEKVHLRIALKGAHLIRTIGTFYSPLTPEQLAELKPHSNNTCPVCGDHELTVIPIEERHQESVEDIQSRSNHPVDWMPDRLVRSNPPTEKSEWVYRNYPNTPTVSASPPPW